MFPQSIAAAEIDAFIETALADLRAMPADATDMEITGRVYVHAAMIFRATAIMTRSLIAAEVTEQAFLKRVAALDRPANVNATPRT